MEFAVESVEQKVSWTGRPVGARPSRRAYLMVTGFALVLVALPFWFWYDSWFGRALPDASIEEFLNNKDKPRRAQQALIQIGEKMTRGDVSVRRWYPRVVALSTHPSIELRQTTAWIMGQDRSYEPFREALRKMASDGSLLVRRNAALGLAAFRDSAGLAEVRTMLRPHIMTAPVAGVLKYRLKEGEYCNSGTLLGRIGETEVRSDLPGEVRKLLQKDGTVVQAGDPLVELSTDDQHVWEALRALFLIGNREDLDQIRPFLRSPNQKLQEQAQRTLRQIESR